MLILHEKFLALSKKSNKSSSSNNNSNYYNDAVYFSSARSPERAPSAVNCSNKKVQPTFNIKSKNKHFLVRG